MTWEDSCRSTDNALHYISDYIDLNLLIIYFTYLYHSFRASYNARFLNYFPLFLFTGLILKYSFTKLTSTLFVISKQVIFD